MLYAAPGAPGAKLQFKAQYDNFIGGAFVPPVKGQYFDVITPITGKPYQGRPVRDRKTSRRHSTPHMPRLMRGRTSPGERSNILLKIAMTASMQTSRCSRTPRPSITARRSAKH